MSALQQLTEVTNPNQGTVLLLLGAKHQLMGFICKNLAAVGQIITITTTILDNINFSCIPGKPLLKQQHLSLGQ